MKKVLLLTAAGLFTLTIFLNSCKEDNPIACTQKLVELSSATQDYEADASSANCTAYKNAINDYIDCDIVTNAQTEVYEATLAQLDC